MKSKRPSPPDPAVEPLTPMIYLLREPRVILDADLARIYGVPTKVFNRAVKRNQERFPDDFAFQLTVGEFAELKAKAVAANSSQIATSSSQAVEKEGPIPNWSQFVTSSSSRRGAAYRP